MLSREEATRPERLWREYSEQREAEREHQAERWRADYEAYLLSPEWDDKRALVLKRARGICEGCGEVPATEVHHLTYTHVGNELLWQLVAVCRQLPRPRSRYRGRQHCGGGTWQSSSWVISAQRTRACGPVFRNCNSLSESLEKTGDATNDRTDVLRQV
jgi:hypothetical protein